MYADQPPIALPAAHPAGADRVASARERALGLRLLALDVDGTLTDGSIWIGTDGEALKRFSVHDGFGLTLLREAGLHIAIITGRQSGIVQARAAELRIAHVLQGVQDKADALRRLCAQLGITPAQAAFMGDDWPDLPAMQIAGLALAPADAAPPVRDRADWVAASPGGHGAVREFAEWWLAERKLLEPMLARYLAPQATREPTTLPPSHAA
jgi:3-deoxy-D-manno-octulosonate 8-phosphate phosphatase (KDO 8-P phosphatase)